MCTKCEVAIAEQVQQGTKPCEKCAGRGWVTVGRGYTENGVYRGATGVCFSCQGRKTQSPQDVRRNVYYVAHYYNPPVVA